MEIDDSGISTGIPGVSESKYSWEGIVASAQNERATLLYLGPARFLFFPTRVMSPDQRAELDDLIARHIVKRKPC
jgi:hypothetical protein